MDEWIAKRELTPRGYPLSAVHLVFEEWFDTGHVRVSVRGDGSYAIELDGAVRWSGPRAAPGRRGARAVYSADKGGFAFLHHFGEFSGAHYMMRNLSGGPPLPAFPPCPAAGDDGAGPYHATMTLLLEHPRPAVLRSWWTEPGCAGFPRAIARDAWDLVERVAAGSVARPSWHASTSRSAPPPRTHQDAGCGRFGGRIHGESSCVRLDLATGRLTSLARRTDGPASASLGCDSTADVGGHRVALTCALTRPLTPAGADTMQGVVSASVDGRHPVALDTHLGFWDFIHVWVRPGDGALEITIDYGVYD